MVQKIEISWRTIVFTFLFFCFVRILWLSRELIYALFLAFIFMSALKPAVNLLEKQRLPRFLATLIVFFTALFLLVFVVSFIFPPLVTESLAFTKNLPLLIGHTIPAVSQYFNSDSLTSFLPDITQNFIRVVGSIFSNFIFIISIIFFTFYFLLEERLLKNFLERFIDDSRADYIVSIATKAERRMGAWVWGELVLMTVIGVMTYIGLSLLQVRYALPLAVFAGLLEVVPIIGPTISAIPAFFVAASTSWFFATTVVILYFIIQQVENNLIVPFVMKKAVGIHPIITLIALTVGGKLGGLLGVFLSVPVALFIETVLIDLAKMKR